MFKSPHDLTEHTSLSGGKRTCLVSASTVRNPHKENADIVANLVPGSEAPYNPISPYDDSTDDVDKRRNKLIAYKARNVNIVTSLGDVTSTVVH